MIMFNIGNIRKSVKDLCVIASHIMNCFRNYSDYQSFSQCEIDETFQELMEYYYPLKINSMH
jgi:hypothetical protein